MTPSGCKVMYGGQNSNPSLLCLPSPAVLKEEQGSFARRGLLAISGDIFWLSGLEKRCYWHLVRETRNVAKHPI